MQSSYEKVWVRMTPDERCVLEREISRSNAYLEYGCGGSTELATFLARGPIVSIESDTAWISALKEKTHISEAIKSSKLQLLHVDIGPVREWGAPIDAQQIRNWPQYYLTPFTRFDLLYDLIVIDGRFRQSCALAAYALGQDRVRVIIHDYVVREAYHDIEKFFNVEESVDTLVVLTKKKGVHQRTLYESIFKFLFAF